jgi:hypothetical protein
MNDIFLSFTFLQNYGIPSLRHLFTFSKVAQAGERTPGIFGFSLIFSRLFSRAATAPPTLLLVTYGDKCKPTRSPYFDYICMYINNFAIRFESI